MPLNQSTAARQARDLQALGGTITAMGRRHNGLHHRLPRVNGIGLHRDSRYCRPSDKDGNLVTVPEGYRLAGIGLALVWTRHLQEQRSGQHSHRSRHPVYQPILDPGTFLLEYGPSFLDSVPSTDRRADGASKPDDGAVPPGFLQLRAGQLGRTLAVSGIRLK